MALGEIYSKYKKVLAALIKLGIVIFSFAYIFYSVHEEKTSLNDFFDLTDFTSQNVLFLALSLLLLPFNWASEAYKWKFILNKAKDSSFLEAFKGVITGVSLSVFAGNIVGHYFGRIWQLRGEERVIMRGGFLIGAITQAYVTFLFGVVGLLVLIFYKNDASIWMLLLALSLLLISTGVIFLSNKWVSLFKRMPRFWKWIKIMESFGKKDILILISISVLRYSIFSIQFYCIASIFNLTKIGLVNFFSGTFLMFATKSLLPNLNVISDIGIRGGAALFFFQKFDAHSPEILVSSFAMWSINIIIPSIIGLFFLKRAKVFR